MEKDVEYRGGKGGVVRLSLAMVLVQVFQTGMAIMSKLALDQGMLVFPFLVYRNAIGALCVACLAFVLERKHLRKLSWRGGMWIFTNALLGLTLGMSLYYYGLRDTTAAYSSIFLNLIPVATFAFSVMLRTEKLDLGRVEGVLKVFGTIVCVGGAMIISLHKGKTLNLWPLHAHVSEITKVKPKIHDFSRGTGFLVGSCLCYACWFILQVKVVKELPCIYWGTALSCLAGCLQSAVVGVLVNKEKTDWMVKTNLQLGTVLYSGLLNVAVTFVLVTWAVSKKGPAFPPMFAPLSLIFVTITETIFMGLQLTLGSILGMILIIAGIYAFLWGKSRETAEDESLPSHSVLCDSRPAPNPPIKSDLPI
ncbi:WAT1-related protein At1g43650-like [Wolffia australiana]